MVTNSDLHLKLPQLRALVAVADWGTFSEAALQLGVSQSGISHAIASLEEELGVILFKRDRRRSSLTPVGEEVTAQARQILGLLNEINAIVDRAKGLRGGIVRVASFRSAATHILPEVIAKFRQRFPAITVSLHEYHDYPEVEQALRSGLADIGFVCLPNSKEFETWEMYQDEYLALFPPDFRRLSTSLTWEELLEHPLLLPPSTEITYTILRNHCQALGKQIRVGFHIKEDSTMVSMVAQGLGVAIIPRLAAEPLPPGIQAFSLPVPLFRVIGIAVLAEALHLPAVFAFLEMLKSNEKK
jgi:DNA-binding transcriptional LysR family regulator